MRATYKERNFKASDLSFIIPSALFLLVHLTLAAHLLKVQLARYFSSRDGETVKWCN